MISFCIIGHNATTDGSFSLNDLSGKAGRLDLICRAIGSGLFLSHGIRKEVMVTVLLMGQPKPGVIVQFNGNKINKLSPDERNIASFIKIALGFPLGSVFREVMPGLLVKKGGLSDIISERQYALLDENGTDVRKRNSDSPLPDAYILSDNRNFTPEEMILLQDLPKYSLGPAVVHADHAIVLLLNELDRRSSGWN